MTHYPHKVENKIITNRLSQTTTIRTFVSQTWPSLTHHWSGFAARESEEHALCTTSDTGMNASELQQFYSYEQRSITVTWPQWVHYNIPHDSHMIVPHQEAVQPLHRSLQTAMPSDECTWQTSEPQCYPWQELGRSGQYRKKVVTIVFALVQLLLAGTWQSHDSHLKMVSLHTFHDSSMREKFLGTMAATTPIGAHPFTSVSISWAHPIHVTHQQLTFHLYSANTGECIEHIVCDTWHFSLFLCSFERWSMTGETV